MRQHSRECRKPSKDGAAPPHESGLSGECLLCELEASEAHVHKLEAENKTIRDRLSEVIHRMEEWDYYESADTGGCCEFCQFCLEPKVSGHLPTCSRVKALAALKGDVH